MGSNEARALAQAVAEYRRWERRRRGSVSIIPTLALLGW